MQPMQVIFSVEGRSDFDDLPVTIQVRIAGIIDRLAHWPDVSGAKALRKEWRGAYRIRTGDWRVIFEVRAAVIIVRIRHRSQVYED